MVTRSDISTRSKKWRFEIVDPSVTEEQMLKSNSFLKKVMYLVQAKFNFMCNGINKTKGYFELSSFMTLAQIRKLLIGYRWYILQTKRSREDNFCMVVANSEEVYEYVDPYFYLIDKKIRRRKLIIENIKYDNEHSTDGTKVYFIHDSVI